MQDQSRAPRLAVLIDADNASPRLSDDLFREIAKIGEASVRRIYGDFSSSRMGSWLRAMPEHAILPQMNLANTTGKNASDIALVIDAMDLLHTGRFEGFCLVSSDSDFTRLAARIREQGVAVYGFGEKKTPKSFVQACQRFIYTENLATVPEEDAPAATRTGDAKPAKATKGPHGLIAMASNMNSPRTRPTMAYRRRTRPRLAGVRRMRLTNLESSLASWDSISERICCSRSERGMVAVSAGGG